MKMCTKPCNRTIFVALSFDDGYLRHVTIARLLARIGIRATFYCITHLKTFEGKTLLHPEYIEEIADLGHEVGSHTCDHRDLTRLPKDKLNYELRASKLLLEDLVGDEILGMAYPYGYFNAEVLSEVSKYYQYARSAGVYEIENIGNVKPLNRYIMGALTIPHLSKSNLPIRVRDLSKWTIKVLKRREAINLVLLAHDIRILKLIAIILYLRMLGAHFTTVSELVDHMFDLRRIGRKVKSDDTLVSEVIKNGVNSRSI